MNDPLSYWRDHLNPAPILADPHVPLPSTLLNLASILDAVLNMLTTLSEDDASEKEHGVAVAKLAVEYTVEVLRHLGLGDDGKAPPLLNLKMAQMVLSHLRGTTRFYLNHNQNERLFETQDSTANRQEEFHVEAQEATAQPTSDPIIDTGTFTVTFKGKQCKLGNTMAFRLLARLSTSPNIFIHLDTLKDDVWPGKEVSDEGVQRQISTLRKKFEEAGVEGIDFESTPQHYRLVLR